jgi:DNA gyrase/topoisomerase IV subunit B
LADGEAIANGLCYAFARYARFLIDFGMVYLIESPFFRDYQGKYYFPSDPVVPGTEFPIGMDTSKPFKRYKGLGELNPDELKDMYLNPANRKLVKVTLENIEDAMEMDNRVIKARITELKINNKLQNQNIKICQSENPILKNKLFILMYDDGDNVKAEILNLSTSKTPSFHFYDK